MREIGLDEDVAGTPAAAAGFAVDAAEIGEVAGVGHRGVEAR